MCNVANIFEVIIVLTLSLVRENVMHMGACVHG